MMNTIYYTGPEDLIAEHFEGRYTGLLNVAQDMLLRLRATMGFASDEEIVEAAALEGISEGEIAAALAIESGDYLPITDPFGPAWAIK